MDDTLCAGGREPGGFRLAPGRFLLSSAALTYKRSVPPLVDAAEPQAMSGRDLAHLAHPLPAGMRDLLPPEAGAQAELVSQLLKSLDLHGYLQVELPAFEYASVLERGIGALDPSEVVRFIEPGTGEVVVLRPDMTPQVARLVATRLGEAPAPARIAYRGSVVRQRRQRARRHREIPQVGLELIGLGGQAGDLEVLTAATRALAATGLASFTLDLGNVKITRALLASVSPPERSDLIEALHLKDSASLARRAERLGVSKAETAALAALAELHGGPEVWPRAERVLAGTAAELALAELRELAEAVEKYELASSVLVDLGETWDFNYYTGAVFHLLAEGPGEPIGSGGRYDGLSELFGAPNYAAGFAIDVSNLSWALEKSGRKHSVPRVVVADDQADAAILSALRQRGVRVATAKAADLSGFAQAWAYSHQLELKAGQAVLRDQYGVLVSCSFESAASLAEWIKSRVN
ncbi:MAG: ATP phosphoribosyltransferase regulatory subunit [Polyangiaceae bacterium]|nr:ATP phosphoribosyltransferase regulatory subunit [Polyangiaceae bacterium]